MKNFIKKGNYTKTKLIISFIISISVSIGLVVIMPNRIWDRLPIFSIILMFTAIHGIFPLKKIYDFIYNKRYLLALIVFVYIVVMGYSGSSIGVYQYAIQPADENINYGPVLGDARPIRSDEWNVGTPIEISQVVDQENPFSYYNDNLRGTNTEMFSVSSAPIADILILAKPFFIGFLLFGAEHGLAFFWYAKVIALMLVSFELCMLISKKNKLVSLFGMILIVFSAATQWWNITDYVVWGGLALILLDKFMLTDKYRIKLACAFGIFISAISYIFILYPAWQLTYGYVFLAIFIWIIWKNRKLYKMNIKDVLIILLVILAIAGIGFRYYTLSKDVLNIVSNTDYPGERFEIGSDASATLFSYVYSMFFPYENDIGNPCELSGMLSIYPIPMIISIIFLIRNKDRKEHFAYLIPMILIGIMLAVWCTIPTNNLFAKLTFLYMAPATRVAVPLGFLQIMLMIYIMGNIKEDNKVLGKYSAIVIGLIASTLIMSIAIRTDYEHVLGNLKSYICGIILFFEIYLLFTINNKKSQYVLIGLLIPIALITGATVNPIQKGISVLTDKPVAKEVQKIVKEDPKNNLWLAEAWPDYYLANGAKVVNSVNTYPNFELFKTILKEKADEEEYRKIYNRYAHIYMQIIEEESTIELIQSDALIIKINPDTIKDIGVKYIISSNELEQYSNDNVKFEKIYEEQEVLIYKAIY